MPSQKPKTHEKDKFHAVPLTIFKIQSIAQLSSLETMIFNHVILMSINHYNDHNSSARQSFVFSATEFSRERGMDRRNVLRAMSKLLEYGLVKYKEATVRTISGMQKRRQYWLPSNDELHQVYELLSTTKTNLSVVNHTTLKKNNYELSVVDITTVKNENKKGVWSGQPQECGLWDTVVWSYQTTL